MICINCHNEISEEGTVYWLFIPFLVLILGWGHIKGCCKDCADNVNALGALVSVIGLVVVVLVGLNYLSK